MPLWIPISSFLAQSPFPTIDTGTSLSLFGVWIGGLLSFFSPCVLPIIPLYMAYLSGGSNQLALAESKQIRRRTLMNTLCFVIGICFTYVLLALGTSFISTFIAQNKILFQRLAGGFIILLGTLQLVLSLRGRSLSGEKRLSFDWSRYGMKPWVALILGFTFSFAWTPCVGPQLAAVLSLSATASTKNLAYAYMFFYVLGFIIPFILLGFFTTEALRFLKKHRSILAYTTIAGAVLMILLGVLLFMGLLHA